MGIIKKSIRNLIIIYLRQSGSSALKDIVKYVISERPEVKSCHIRGVIYNNIRRKSGIFNKDDRGTYSLIKKDVK